MTLMLLEWVITSIFLILTVLALRAAFGKRVSARLRYALWAVVLVRLLVPVQLFTSPLAGTRFFSGNQTEQTVTQWPITSAAHATAGPDDVLVLNLPNEPLTGFPNAPQAPEPPTVPIATEAPADPDLSKAPAWLGWIWLGGSIVLALVLAASNLRFALRLRRSRIPLDGTDCPLPVYMAVGLPSPCLFGLARPAVYVTPEAAADPAMLRHVIAHEHTHFRQGDHLWSFLRCAALAVHWGNPLVWLVGTLSRRDGELACDEGALKRLGDGERLAYGNTLLALVTARPAPGDLLCFATTMAGEKRSLKERISRIANAPKRWLWAAAAMVLVTALACACAFGSAEEPDSPDTSDLAADLTFSFNEDGTAVRIEGSVDGIELKHTLWFTPTWFGLYDDLWPKLGLLGFEMPLCDNEVVCSLDARWTDESRTVVRVTATPRARISSYAPSDNLIFTVDLRSGTVLELEGYIPKLSANAPELVPTEAEAVRTARVAAKLLTEAEDYYQSQAGEPAGPDSGLQTDLNRNGAPETVRITELDGGAGQRLEIWEDGELIFSEEGFYAHAGCNALFLCTLDGQDYLLRYNPYMAQGFCDYRYELFTLKDGSETLTLGNHAEFDINFGSPVHMGFNPEAIAAFMDEVNSLLAHSVQLINTDAELLDAFQKEGRLYDGRWQLDPAASMLENLREYKASMEPNYQSVLLGQSQFLLMQDEAGYFLSMDDVPALICGDDPYAQIWSFAVVDMDGDGTDEVLVWACGISGDASGYLLLRQENGTVYGAVFNAHNNWSNRWFNDLKTDGTFECEDILDRWSSVSKLFFTPRGGVGIYGLTVIRDDPDYNLESFMSIQNEVAREEDWLAAVEAQREKPGVEWYDFNNEESIAALFAH